MPLEQIVYRNPFVSRPARRVDADDGSPLDLGERFANTLASDSLACPVGTYNPIKKQFVSGCIN
jgi:hypothetical protein